MRAGGMIERAPAPTQRWFERAIHAYRTSRLHEIWYRGGCPCRFIPSCSDYAMRAIREWGAVPGIALALWRLLRCNPWSRAGIDFPPRRRQAQGAILHGFRLVDAPCRTAWRLYSDRDCRHYTLLAKSDVIHARRRAGGGIAVHVKPTAAGGVPQPL